MKNVAIFLSLLAATPAFAISRTINCTNSGNGDEHLTVQLRTGMAQLRVCSFAPCSETKEPAAIAELVQESEPEAPVSLLYQVVESDGTLVNDTVGIELPERARPVVILDGDAGRYTNCR